MSQPITFRGESQSAIVFSTGLSASLQPTNASIQIAAAASSAANVRRKAIG